jgi:hypothetical protein
MVSRPRHQDKGLESLLRSLELQGWRVSRSKRYFKTWCLCDDKHRQTIHLTPNRGYEKTIRSLLTRTTCWKEPQS